MKCGLYSNSDLLKLEEYYRYYLVNSKLSTPFMKKKKSPIPPCPFCDDSTGECDHVVLDYDYTFGEYKGGYLRRDDSEVERIRVDLSKLILQEIDPEYNDPFLQIEDLWDYALETYNKKSGEFDLDYSSYFRNFYYSSDFYDGVGFKYKLDGEDERPGFSSEYIIIYSENPQETVRKYNRSILSALKKQR